MCRLLQQWHRLLGRQKAQIEGSGDPLADDVTGKPGAQLIRRIFHRLRPNRGAQYAGNAITHRAAGITWDNGGARLVQAMSDSTASQWDRLLKNLGAWRGSFTRLSPTGEQLDDLPSLVSLEGLDEHRTIHQIVRLTSPVDGAVVSEKSFRYSSLNQNIQFFPDGAFCQGSVQIAPFGDFGAEFGLIAGNRRLRLVQLYDNEHRLSRLTLIREHREDRPEPESPPLTVEALEGTWQGESLSLYPDFQPPSVAKTFLTVERRGDQLVQQLRSDHFEWSSTARIDGARLLFEEGSQPVQVLLMAGGASCTGPLVHTWGKPVFMEVGWLVEPGLRQRMIRRFAAKGEWVSLTLVTERRV